VKRILVVDPEHDSRLTSTALLRQGGYEVHDIPDESGAFQLLHDYSYDLIITDLSRPQCECDSAVLKWIQENAPQTAVIILTSHGSIDCVVKTIQMGATDYILKPGSDDEFLKKVEGAIQKTSKHHSIPSRKEPYRIHDIVGISRSMERIIEMALKISHIGSNVLIYGESGTGKELVAKAIHYHGRTEDERPFVAINSAAIPDHILESELFGYAKGAFTGAVRDKKGLLEEANGGTLFLDEIGDASPQFQSKLLRVIEEQKMRRVGDTRARKINVRFIAATNKNIVSMVSEGTFRADLYYRLGIVEISIPPLKNRKEDIYPLITHFLHDISKRLGKKIKGISDETVQVLLAYDWPGNVRELKNSIERAVALSGNKTLEPEDFPIINSAYHDSLFSGHEDEVIPLKEIEKRYLLKIMKKYSYNQKLVAKKLGIGYTTLWRKLKEIENDM